MNKINYNAGRGVVEDYLNLLSRARVELKDVGEKVDNLVYDLHEMMVKGGDFKAFAKVGLTLDNHWLNLLEIGDYILAYYLACECVNGLDADHSQFLIWKDRMQTSERLMKASNKKNLRP